MPCQSAFYLLLVAAQKKPVIKLLSVLYIEFVRSVPVITLLFMASLMIQFFLPEGLTIDIFMRVLIVLIMFTAAYMAETIRGGYRVCQAGNSKPLMPWASLIGKQ